MLEGSLPKFKWEHLSYAVLRSTREESFRLFLAIFSYLSMSVPFHRPGTHILNSE